MTIREELEKIEEQILSSHAQKSSMSRGRMRPEEKCPVRMEYQRDRDRITYSKAFRRLKHKTQVFISPEGDHYRTRLTHTLEVTQIGRTIARSLRLNEDLTEAIALGHDLGHPPFGHAGENVLNAMSSEGFKHNEQSLRVVDLLEKDRGLNLTAEVRDGILNHTANGSPVTLEGQIIQFADKIAYINHDIEDAIRGGIISERDLPGGCVKVLGYSSSQRINNMILDIISNSHLDDKIAMSCEFAQATSELREFMFERIYVGSEAKKEEIKARVMLEQLYIYLRNHPEYLPENVPASERAAESIDRKVCDHIAGMTDRYAVKTFSDIYIPAAWGTAIK